MTAEPSIISVKTSRPYDIHLGASLQEPNRWLPTRAISHIVIITDHAVKKLYGLDLRAQCESLGFKTLLLSFPPGEKSKTQKIKEKLEHAMLKFGCDRQSLILALGGGVVGDIAGFIAATYHRGIAYLQVPTTLLAMVDSSIGGKTGINTPFGKNSIGAIYQPLGVVNDIACLRTLSHDNKICGLIEAIKVFATSDADSFAYACNHLPRILQNDATALKEVITRAVILKAELVSRDEAEHGERSILNFGHTIGHAMEKIMNYKIPHGYAVACGMLVESKISYHLGQLSQHAFTQIKHLLNQLGITGSLLKKINTDKLLQATYHDKKIQSGQVRYVLLTDIGSIYTANNAYVHVVADEAVKTAIDVVVSEIPYGR